MASSSPPPLYPSMDLALVIHRISQGRSSEVEALKERLTEGNSYKLWETLKGKGLPLGDVPKSLKENAAAEVSKVEEKLKSAKETEGETEVQEILLEKANLLAKHGEYALSNGIYGDVKQQPKVTSGKKIEAGLGEARNRLFVGDDVGSLMETIADLCKDGGDWDKRNRHAAYFALHLLRTRDIRQAATLMKAGVKTFNAEEVCDFKEFCKLCTLASVVTASRESLKKDIIDSPEIRAQLGNDEEGKIVLNVAKSLYESKYSDFFRGVLKLISVIDMDVYVKPHCNYIVRELVVRGYTQFLRSYQSVTVENMASEFGVSPSYIDSTLASFISANRLDVKIDKVNGVVETLDKGTRGKGYEGLVKEGDKVLNKMARLTRVTEV